MTDLFLLIFSKESCKVVQLGIAAYLRFFKKKTMNIWQSFQKDFFSNFFRKFSEDPLCISFHSVQTSESFFLHGCIGIL